MFVVRMPSAELVFTVALLKHQGNSLQKAKEQQSCNIRRDSENKKVKQKKKWWDKVR